MFCRRNVKSGRVLQSHISCYITSLRHRTLIYLVRLSAWARSSAVCIRNLVLAPQPKAFSKRIAILAEILALSLIKVFMACRVTPTTLAPPAMESSSGSR